jgi:hypothetical protein
VSAPPLNSPLEAGLRALAFLSVTFPRAFDISSLTILDHILLHSSDFGGPPSLHPDVPNHQSEITVKRDQIEHGLIVMIRAKLIKLIVDDGGISYAATDDGPGFVGLLESDYMKKLQSRAYWLAEAYGGIDNARLRSLTARLGNADPIRSTNDTFSDYQGEP